MTDLLNPSTTTTSPTTQGGTFAGSTSVAPANPSGVLSMAPGQFFAEYQINSTEQAMYITNGKLNSNAAELASYYQMSQTSRQSLEQGLVDAGLMKQSDATGIVGTSGLDAFKTAIGQAQQANLPVTDYLNQKAGGGLGPLEQQIASQKSAAQSTLNRQTPVTATVDNPTSLEAALTNAFDQTVGYAPSSDQLSAFVSALQGQEAGTAQAGNEATKAQAQQDLNRAQSAESALNKLGPDGIDSFLSAYANAIHGTGVAGAGTTQGPATGSTANSPAAGQYLTPGAQLSPNSFAGFNPSGAEMQGNTTPESKQQTSIVPTNPWLGPFTPHGGQEQTTTVTTPTPGMATAPNLPPNLTGTTNTYGGIYALTPKLWQQAQALTPAAKKYATAGTAPQAVQQAAVTALATSLYDKANNWHDVAIELAGGTPGKDGKVLGKSNIQDFATGVANDVNTQIESLQSQINAPGPAVTEKVTAPDVTSEANLAAKTADPVGYYASNVATAGSLLNQMLAGAPSMYGQSGSDTFTGPVPEGEAAAPTPAPAAA